ncbi:hypothetical protein B5C34_01145 [Pacificimonas flava]|uniref:Thioesterase domain-containing protein n=2 Tax=Pacificimonas TaxID=1960290 RepID=A0A219B232_9SPHN|nr:MULTISPECIES: PaaI family thioesterase [Pacificimonas]MBZ6378179.1 PaaI family thioesterase [Pacificimonas aurantium]OWV32193.1 hypothetical protein B5C34_01145 [Pacificimonas flava]
MSTERTKRRTLVETEGPFEGWTRWHAENYNRFSDLIGPSWFKWDGGGIGEGKVVCRIPTEQRHANWQDYLHGGFLMAFIDQVLFAVAMPSLREHSAVTLTCNTEFVGGGKVGTPLDGSGEIVKETGKTIFIRGELYQPDNLICAFSGVLRKFPRK